MDIDTLTPVAQDYVKAIWTATEWGDPPASTTVLAARFGTSAANVSETMKRLTAQGLVVYERYKPAVLTDRGAAVAVAMVRRHRLIETFLVTTLGYEWDQVHEEAERLEHAVTDEFIDRIDQHLGRPAADPHGDPIPDAQGRSSPPPGARRLGHAEPGEYVVRRVSDADPEQLAEATRLGLRPGRHVVLRRPEGGEETTLEAIAPEPLPLGTASAIWVTPAEPTVSPG
ncbi:metal-dependent transcriptional regulator [uncultured Amnibacterium sp.]|uniref:metal-dependent transcriptional regulator n=1 Tax=uncultured Amnibacterium sp. TaxID=1631851 RepID=UPI0035CA853E